MVLLGCGRLGPGFPAFRALQGGSVPLEARVEAVTSRGGVPARSNAHLKAGVPLQAQPGSPLPGAGIVSKRQCIQLLTTKSVPLFRLVAFQKETPNKTLNPKRWETDVQEKDPGF